MDIENPAATFDEPQYLSGRSGWVSHIPFGMALVGWLRPRVLVELGTFYGDSYCAFCQAVERSGAGTSCAAIDTWEGDPQTGTYGPKVFDQLSRYHDATYGAFSRLIRARFDDALGTFADGSIDLLHIDGLHTYDAVRHDYQVWLPKVSPNGVILFHDTRVKRQNFGVWRLWEEISANCPSFEFHHGHGLGVLALGEARGDFERFMDWARRSPDEARQAFRALGRRVSAMGRRRPGMLRRAKWRLWPWALGTRA